MIAWLTENMATILVAAVLIAVIALVIVGMIKNKKKGRGACSCGCDCGGCPQAGTCRSTAKAPKNR